MKLKYIDRLLARIGKTRKTRGVMRGGVKGDSFCILGILCDEVEPIDWYKVHGVWSHQMCTTSPSSEVREKAELAIYEMEDLMDANDSYCGWGKVRERLLKMREAAIQAGKR